MRHWQQGQQRLYLHWGPGHPQPNGAPRQNVFTGIPLQLIFAEVKAENQPHLLHCYLQLSQRSTRTALQIYRQIDRLIYIAPINSKESLSATCFVCHLSTKKCVTHKNYSVNNVPLSQVDKVRDLGIIVYQAYCRSILYYKDSQAKLS